MTAPYWSDNTCALYLGDMREVLPALGITADLVLADPPYGETSLAWDRWPEGWPAVAARSASSLWCFGSLRMFLDRRDDFAGWKLSHDVIWEKPGPAAASPVVAGFRTPAPVKPVDVGVALHTRWHINRGITNPDCEHCTGRVDLGICRECGAPLRRRRHRRGYCRRCYRRWWKAGRPADGPPPPRSPNRDLSAANAALKERAAGRREDYFWLRDEHGLTREQAAERVGICLETARRYDVQRRRAVAS